MGDRGHDRSFGEDWRLGRQRRSPVVGVIHRRVVTGILEVGEKLGGGHHGERSGGVVSRGVGCVCTRWV